MKLEKNLLKSGETVKADIDVHPVGDTTRKGKIVIKTDNSFQPTTRLKYLFEGVKKLKN